MKNKLNQIGLIALVAVIIFTMAGCGDPEGGATGGGGTAPTITTASLPGGTVGTAYSQTLTATGDTPITWSVESGALPDGLSLTTGVIAGTPTTANTFNFTVKATNAAGSDTKALSIVIAASKEGGDDIVISIAAIAGVIAPVQGATPVTAITANDQYTGTVAWNGTPATFDYDTVYTATITLTAKTGYTLQGVTEDFFTVAGATSVSNAANSGIVTAVFPQTEDDPALDDLLGDVTISPNTDVKTHTQLTATYSGTEEVSFQWQKNGDNIGAASTTNPNTYTPVEEGSYTVIVSADGYNSKSATVTVTTADLAGSITISPSTGVTTGTELTATYSGSETVSYQWKKDGNNVGTNSNTYTPTEAGSYTVTVSAAGYNPQTSDPVIVPTLTGITAVYSGPATVDQSTPINNLKMDLTVTAQYSNNTSKPVTDYTLSGTLTITGPSVITVTWEGETTTFTVNAYALFTTPADMTTFLNNQPANTAATAYDIKMNAASTWTTEGSAKTAFNGKYVNLDLSGSTFTSFNLEAFMNCDLLTGITIPASVTSITNTTTSGGTFSNCTSLTSVTFASGSQLTTIGNRAFFNCTSLASVTIPEGVTTIGQSAFQGCTSLTGITIPEGVTTISNSVFSGCSKLAGSITIPEGVTAIRGYAFRNCTSLTGITIPEGVTTIEWGAFENCSKLAGSITIPEGVTSISQSAFSGCSSLTGITIPASVTTIGTEAFRGCTLLTGITIPEGVTSIGSDAFYYCSSLTVITIPNSVTSIGSSAFNNCTRLASVTFAGTIASGSFSTTTPFPGDLRTKYLAAPGGGIGTYTATRAAGDNTTAAWTKQ